VLGHGKLTTLTAIHRPRAANRSSSRGIRR
jgi:hypothetical protein